jgi:ubiquinone/menaquinone biosynthesis C-methylase UbiE
MNESHVFDAKNVNILEAENRKIWQNPEDILDAIELNRSYVAADLGCGSGFFTIPLSRKVKKVYGIDMQKKMLKYLEQKINNQRIENIIPLLSKENEIPLENESLDLLISTNTLHEFSDKKQMIREMQRVLRRNGKAVIVDFKKEKTGSGPPVVIRLSKDQAKLLFEKNGFTFVKSKDLTYHYLIVFRYARAK